MLRLIPPPSIYSDSIFSSSNIESLKLEKTLGSYTSWKVIVKVASTTNISLSGLQIIDGVQLLENDRILIKNQTNAIENGIYNASGVAWTRAEDFIQNTSASGSTVYVSLGTDNGTKTFICTNSLGSDIIGVDNLTFINFIPETEPSGNNLNVQYNNNGVLAGSDLFNFNSSQQTSVGPFSNEVNGTVLLGNVSGHLTTSSPLNGNGNNLLLSSSSAVNDGAGGDVIIFSGDSGTGSNNSSGDILIQSGSATILGEGESGSVVIKSGIGYDTGAVIITSEDCDNNSGLILISSGSTTNNSGTLLLSTGDSINNNSGQISVTSGNANVLSGQISITSGYSNNSGFVTLASGDSNVSSGGLIIKSGYTTGTISGQISITSGEGINSGDIILASGNSNSSTGGDAGSVTITGGNSGNNVGGNGGNGGTINIKAGDFIGSGSLSGQSGNININAGNSTAPNVTNGGNISITAGESAGLTGGSIEITAGNGSLGSGEGGDILISSGSGTNRSGDITIQTGFGATSGIMEIITYQSSLGINIPITFSQGSVQFVKGECSITDFGLSVEQVIINRKCFKVEITTPTNLTQGQSGLITIGCDSLLDSIVLCNVLSKGTGVPVAIVSSVSVGQIVIEVVNASSTAFSSNTSIVIGVLIV